MPFWIKEQRFVGNDSDNSLKGLVSLTNIPDLLQFLSLSGKQGVLKLHGNSMKVDGVVRIEDGILCHVSTARYTGLRALREIISLEDGSFMFTPGESSLDSNLDMPVQFAVMEAVRLNDEEGNGASVRRKEPAEGFDLFALGDDDINWDEDAFSLDEPPLAPKTITTGEASALPETKTASTPNIERNDTAQERSVHMPRRDSTEILSDLLKVPGVDAVVVSGRDGFIIESAGSSSRISIDDLGATIALTINGIEDMGSELEVGRFGDLFIEYGKAVILCKPIGDAVAAIIAPDASKLGIIRHKSKKLFEELTELF